MKTQMEEISYDDVNYGGVLPKILKVPGFEMLFFYSSGVGFQYCTTLPSLF